jgi:hypothetical protein
MKNSHDVNFEVIYPYQQSETYLSVKTDYKNAKQKIYIQKARGFSWPFLLQSLLQIKYLSFLQNMA